MTDIIMENTVIGQTDAKGKLLRRWMVLFGDYCTTADSGQLYQDTEAELNKFYTTTN